MKCSLGLDIYETWVHNGQIYKISRGTMETNLKKKIRFHTRLKLIATRVVTFDLFELIEIALNGDLASSCRSEY